MAEQEVPLFGEETVRNEQNDIIGFASTGEALSPDFYTNTLQRTIVDAITGDKEHSLKDFLARPILFSQIDWKTSDSGIEWNLNDLFQLPTLSRIKEKLKGYYGITATLNFKFVFNAQPFESGMGMAVYFPLESEDDHTFWNFKHSEAVTNVMRLTPMSCLPHALIDLSRGSEMTLSVPHISPTCVISLVDNNPLIGKIRFMTVVPPQSALSVTTIPLRVYFYLTEVVTFGATASVVAQAEESEQAEADSTNLISQIGKTARKIHTFGNDLLKTPVLGDAITPFARPLLRAGDSFLKIFGFSRPADIRMTNISHQILGHTALCDAPSFASKMSVMHNQKVSTIAMGLEKADEMSVSFLASKKAIVDVIDFKVGAPPSFIRSWTVNPNVYRTEEYKQRSFYFPSPLRFVSEMFAMWRGSIIFTFQVVCTNFHSGRLRVVFDVKPSHDMSASDISACYSQIIDIRGSQTFHIKCPFLSVTPWRTVPQFGQVNDTDHRGFFLTESQLPNATHHFGLDNEMQLSLQIESAFRAPDTVSQSIGVVVWVSGGEDFEVAHPISCLHPSVIGKPTDLPNDLEPPSDPAFAAPPQPGEEVEPHGIEDDGEIFTFGGNVQNNNAYASTVGEVIRSIRTIIKRPHLQGVHNPQLVKNAFLMIPPWNFGVNMHVYDSNMLQSPLYGDPLHKIFHAYRFYQGGMRLLIRPKDYFTTGTITTISKSSNISTDIISSVNSMTDFMIVNLTNPSLLSRAAGMADATVMSSAIVAGATEVEIPFYTRFPFCATSAEHTSFSTQAIKDVINGYHPDIFVMINIDNPTLTHQDGVEIYRSAADDFSLGYFMFPPLAMANIDYRSTYWGVKKPPVFPAAALDQKQAGAIPLTSEQIASSSIVKELDTRVHEQNNLSKILLEKIRRDHSTTEKPKTK